MRDEEKPFVCYRQGWSIRIVPRTSAGWSAFGVWMAFLGLMVAAFIAILSVLPGDAAQLAVVVGFLAATGIWALAMIRWMLARSEVIAVNELLDLKRQRDRERDRGRR